MTNNSTPKLQPTWLEEVISSAKQEVENWPNWKKPSSLQRPEDEEKNEKGSLRLGGDRHDDK